MGQQVRSPSTRRTPPPPPPPAHTAPPDPARARAEPKLPARRIPWGAIAVAFVAGCSAGAASAWIVASGAESAEATALRERAAQMEAIQDDLVTEVLASEERADAAEAEAERMRRRAARERREPAPARPEPARPRASSAVAVDWGGWDGLFALSERSLGRSGDRATVRGQIRYLGGAPCAVGYVELTATFVAGGQPLGTAQWSARALSEGDPVRVSASALLDRAPERVELLMTDARCAS
jgi:hypothetical protein